MYRIFLLSIVVLFFTNCTNIIAYELSRPIKNANVFDQQIEDIKIYYYTIGEKQNPPLVFLHGLLAFTETYRNLITSLSEKYFVIGIDLPGHGRSAVGKNNLNADKIAEYIIQLTDKINILASIYESISEASNIPTILQWQYEVCSNSLLGFN